MKRSWLTAVAFLLVAPPALSQNAGVVKELSSRTGISVAELQGYLSHCESSQLSMNMCAYRDAVAADLQMQKLLKQMSLRLDQAGKVALAKKQKGWQARAKVTCNVEVEREVGKLGSMRPMVYGQCMAAATQTRVGELRQELHGFR